MLRLLQQHRSPWGSPICQEWSLIVKIPMTELNPTFIAWHARLLRLLVILNPLLLLSVVARGAAPAPSWKQLEPSMYAQYNFCAAGAPDGLYVAGSDGGISWSPDGGQTWARRPRSVGLGRSINGIAYAGGRYVAVGHDNNTPFSLTSSTGVTWTRHDTGLPYGFAHPLRFDGSVFYTALADYVVYSADGIQWSMCNLPGTPKILFYDVSYGAGCYVAVGKSGAIATSTNRTSWTSVASGTTKNLLAVCYGSSGFVAVGEDGAMAVSSDGLTWSSLETVTIDCLNGIDFGNNRYVAVGGSRFTGFLQPAVTLVSDDGHAWRRTSNPALDNLTGVSFANGLFVAYGGALLTSKNGEQWIVRGPPGSVGDFADQECLYGIANGNGVFVAVGDGGVIRHSQDGLNWITQRPGQSQNFWTIGFGNGSFVAGTTDGALLTSPDAKNWQRLPLGAGLIHCVRYLNGQFFALSQSGEILTSPDAVNWARAPQVTGAPLTHIAWDGSQYLISGYDGTILTSQDGTSWTQRSTPTRLPLEGVACGAGKHVAVGAEGVVAVSSDGISWTIGSAGQSNFLRSVIYGMGLFVAVGDDGAILTSQDAITWTHANSGTTALLRHVDFFDGKFVATGGNIVAYSSDGSNWTVAHLDYFGYLEDLTYGNGFYIGVGTAHRLRISADLESWSKGSFDSQGYGTLTDVKFQDGRFIACSGNGNIFTSTNGLDWALQNAGFNGSFNRLACGNGRYVAVGSDGAVLYSSDTTNWSSAHVAGRPRLLSVAFGGGQFVAVGYPSDLATSPDGFFWTKQSVPTTNQLNDVAYGNNSYVAVGVFGEILSSPDATTWALQTNISISLQSVGFSNGKFTAMGDLGAMFTSSDGITWSAGQRDSSPRVYDLMDFQGATFAVGEKGIISVAAPLPTIVTQPLSQQVRSESPMTISVTATTLGPLYYQWYKDGQPLIGATNASLSWANVAPDDAGDYFVRLTSLGPDLDSAHAVLNVTVDQPPVVHLTSPASGTTFRAPASFTLQANASDPNGSITKVEFYQSTSLLGTTTENPYVWPITNLPTGAYVFTAKATDDAGLVGVSSPSTVSVVANQPPTVRLLWPTNGEAISFRANLNLLAYAFDPDGSVVKVEFLSGTNLLGVATGPPYELIADGLTASTYVLVARATDNEGSTTTSSPATITIDYPPEVSILNPTNGTAVVVPGDVILQAKANDVDGTIVNVEYYAGILLLGGATNGPYALKLPDLAPGTYELTAKATDNDGITSISAPVRFTIIRLPLSLSVPQRLPNGCFQFTVSGGSISATDIVETTTDFFNWTPITTNVVTGIPWTVVDAATNFTFRFYRVSESAALMKIVYDNSTNVSFYSYGSTDEFGDEINVQGGGGVLTQFKFEYYLSHNVTGLELADLRFYDSRGPGGSPGNLLFDSGAFSIPPGYNTVTVCNRWVTVPSTFIWTVQFSGLQSRQSAGLIFQNPPRLGSSLDDFWMRTKDGVWALYRFSSVGGPVANFGAQATLVEGGSYPGAGGNGVFITPGLIRGLSSTPSVPPSLPPDPVSAFDCCYDDFPF